MSCFRKLTKSSEFTKHPLIFFRNLRNLQKILQILDFLNLPLKSSPQLITTFISTNHAASFALYCIVLASHLWKSLRITKSVCLYLLSAPNKTFSWEKGIKGGELRYREENVPFPIVPNHNCLCFFHSFLCVSKLSKCFSLFCMYTLIHAEVDPFHRPERLWLDLCDCSI